MVNSKKGSVGIVKPWYISGREREVDPSEGVGPVLPIHCSSHNRTGHFGEHSRSRAARTEELEFHDRAKPCPHLAPLIPISVLLHNPKSSLLE